MLLWCSEWFQRSLHWALMMQRDASLSVRLMVVENNVKMRFLKRQVDLAIGLLVKWNISKIFWLKGLEFLGKILGTFFHRYFGNDKVSHPFENTCVIISCKGILTRIAGIIGQVIHFTNRWDLLVKWIISDGIWLGIPAILVKIPLKIVDIITYDFGNNAIYEDINRCFSRYVFDAGLSGVFISGYKFIR